MKDCENCNLSGQVAKKCCESNYKKFLKIKKGYRKGSYTTFKDMGNPRFDSTKIISIGLNDVVILRDGNNEKYTFDNNLWTKEVIENENL